MNDSFVATPFIRLQGRWLDEAGFRIGSLFTAEIFENKIILVRKDLLNEP